MRRTNSIAEHRSHPRSERGSDLTLGPLEQAALERLSGARLTFAGRRVAHHWHRMPWGQDMAITLWARQKSGFVVAFDTFDEGQVRPHAAVVDSVEDAICFLEDYCTRLPELFLQTDQIIQSLLALHRAASFRQAFLSLVGEALAAWIDLPEKPGRKHQDKATA